MEDTVEVLENPNLIETLGSSTAIQPPEVQEPPYKIYVSWLATEKNGKRIKPGGSILKVHFQEIETEEQILSVLRFLLGDTGLTDIAIITWHPLEG